ncbi:MAG: ATP-binding protein [Bacteroidales bacterium]|nr:ATP-binding protein [Bacteroidales bacterium]
MKELQIYPIGIQTFQKLREDGYKYVDKTDFVYTLAQESTPFFLSRPRRFGKSLLLSTLEAYFQGKKELFRGLALYKLEKEWSAYPVLHLDMNPGNYETPDGLIRHLVYYLNIWEKYYGITEIEEDVAHRFQTVISKANEVTGRKVVILIDEYDKPLLKFVGDEERQKPYRDILKPFYGCLKTMDSQIRFIMITGVTKFSKMSVFSDLNNLDDISLDDEYATACGITEEELLSTFENGIKELAKKQKSTFEETLEKLAKKYDGYHFSAESDGVFNPFSVLCALKKRKFGNYWFSTGTPYFLVSLLKSKGYLLSELEDIKIDADTLGSIEVINTNPIPVLYQSGYLTISGYDPESDLYRLNYPNEEVKESFLKFLLPDYSNLQRENCAFEIDKFVEEVRNGEIDAFLKRLQSLLGSCDYDLILECEKHYQNVLYIVFALMGMRVQVEQHTSQGRIDMVVKTPQYVYVMEFKYHGTAQDAIDQIDQNGYAIPYQTDPRTVYKVGVAFSAKTHTLAQPWMVEKVSIASHQ